MAGQQPAPLPHFGLFLGSNYSLSCAQGSLTLSGQATGLTAGVVRGIGSPVPLPHMSLLFAASGVRNPAPLPSMTSLFGGSSAYVIPLAQGTYTYTGQDVLADYQVSLAKGDYTLSGQAVAFRRAFTLVCGQGSQGVQGQAVQLVRGTKFSLAQGSFSLIGQAVTLTKAASRTLVCAQGTFTQTGNPVTFTRSISMTCGYGTYRMDGVEVFFSYRPLIRETVPYLIGSTADAAQVMVNAIYCPLSFIGSTGTVTAQSPAAFTQVLRGTPITATLGGEIVKVRLKGRRNGLPRYGGRD